MNPVFELNNLHVSLQSHHKEMLPASASAFWGKVVPASQCR